MSKARSIFYVLIGVSVVYLFMLIVVPILGGIISTSNTTMSATSNMSNYPGTLGFFLSIPWILWFVPLGLGMVWTVVILKSK